MLEYLQVISKWQGKSAMYVSAAIVFAVIIIPKPTQAGNDPLIIETPRQLIYLAAADSGDGDSVDVRQKCAVPNSNPDKLPGIDEFVVIKEMPRQSLVEKPVYPEKAKKLGVEGDVWIKALIDKHGNVVEAVIQQETKNDVGFGNAALDAAHECKYEPAIGEDGKPVAVWVTYKVSFRLDEK